MSKNHHETRKKPAKDCIKNSQKIKYCRIQNLIHWSRIFSLFYECQKIIAQNKKKKKCIKKSRKKIQMKKKSI